MLLLFLLRRFFLTSMSCSVQFILGCNLTGITHGEIYRSKSEIDCLIYKLTLDLNTFNEREALPSVMQKDAEKLVRIAEEEVTSLKPIQHLLDVLVNGNASSEY